jgi:predicted lactoylglutathione lyase
MEPRVSIITLGVQDLERSYQFYSKLGFPSSKNPEEGIIQKS